MRRAETQDTRVRFRVRPTTPRVLHSSILRVIALVQRGSQ